MIDSPKRSFFKTISWRVVGSSSTALITYIIVGDIATAGSVGIFQLIANTTLYYFHERIWAHIKF